MTSTLLLRFGAPMQSWGTQSRFTNRDTGLEPSKSGVVGLLCAALGRPRHEPVDDIAALRMGVRVDFEGKLKLDYHTAGGTHLKGHKYGVAKADASKPQTVVSHRYYIADADFLVGLEGENDDLLRRLQRAVEVPKWQLFLGRKAFVPGVPVRVPNGLRLGRSLMHALTDHPWPGISVRVPRRHEWPDRVRFMIESQEQGYEVRMDQPVGAAFEHRRFLPRRIVVEFRTLGKDIPVRNESEDNDNVPVPTDIESAQ